MNKILDKLTIFFLIIICISGCLSCNPKKISKPKTNYDFNIINETTVLLQTTVMSEHLTEEDVSRGTGVIISKRHILTAAHVCEPWKYMVDFDKKFATATLVIDAYGNLWTGEAVNVDHMFDICLFKTDYDIDIKPAKLSRNGPNRNDEYYYVGYPLGIKGKSLSNKLTGYYAGELDDIFSIYNIAAVGGCSGGPIYNKKNEVVGMLIATYPEFHHMSIAIQYRYLKQYIKENTP